MSRFEYNVVPAPVRGEKARGAKTTGDRFAVALMSVMNRMGAEGWEYLRADTLPCEERVGLTGKATAFHHMLVFRRALPQEAADLPAVQVALSPTPAPPLRPEPALAPMPRNLFADAEPEPDTLGEVTRILRQPSRSQAAE